MFKKREKPQAARARDGGEGDGETGSVPLVAKRARHQAGGASSSTSGLDGGKIAASTKRGDADVNAAKADKYGDAALSGFHANDSASFAPSSDATRRLEVDTEVSQDHRAVLERNQEIHKNLKEGKIEAGVYRGLGAYKQYAERSEGAISANKFTGTLGPSRGMSNVRSTLRIEYIGTTGEGGVCKDYKETGYCGFGDSCKFLHDRSDYKPSYILEKEWEEKQKAIQDKKRQRWEKRMKRKQLAAGQGLPEESSDDDDSASTSDSDDEELPQDCPECRTRWDECKSIPIQTVCGHYFCEDCALAQFAKSPKCLICEAPTNGIFNSCEALEEKIKAKKAAAAAKKKAKKEQKHSVYGVSQE